MASSAPPAGLQSSPAKQAEARAEMVEVPRKVVLIPALLSALLLWCCYFPMAIGWMAWFSLVPWLTLVLSKARDRTVYLAAWLGGLVFFFAALQWMRVADIRMYATWVMLAVYCSVYVPLAIYLLRWIHRELPIPFALTVPMVWTALEWVRAHLMTGFAWYFLGHTQHDAPRVIQISDIGGAYAVTFLVAAVNGLILDLLVCFSIVRRCLHVSGSVPSWRIPLLALIFVDCLAVGTWLHGEQRLSQSQFQPGPRVSFIQGNLDQRLRNATMVDEKAGQKMYDHFALLTDYAALQPNKPALIVWPETSHPSSWELDLKGEPYPISVDLQAKTWSRWRIPVLLGMHTCLGELQKVHTRYNSAVLIAAPNGDVSRYDKIHCVPFGEYVPLVRTFPFMRRFAPYDTDYDIASGPEVTALPAGDFSFGVLICIEDSNAVLARTYVHGERKVDFFVNISNDGWFDGSAEHDEHLAICRFRAVETRRAIGRAVNMGISAVIDGNGRVLRPVLAWSSQDIHGWEIPDHAEALPVSEWHKYKKVKGVLTGSVPIDSRPSLYAQWGDWLPWSCWGSIGLLLVGALLARSRRGTTPA